MKRKVLIIGGIFLFILSSGMPSSVYAVDYGIGISQNEYILWDCKVCNKAEMDAIFGTEWDNSGIFTNLSQGDSMKWKIDSIEINSTFISIEYDLWYWDISDEWGVKDNTSQINMFLNPENYATGISFLTYISLVPFLFPIPVGEYLGVLSVKLNDWYDVDNRVLPTLNLEVPKDAVYPSYPNKDIKIIAIYNDRGILDSYKLYINNNRVILDIDLDFLPIYVMPSLIGLMVVFSLGLGYYLIKRKNINHVRSTKNDINKTHYSKNIQ